MLAKRIIPCLDVMNGRVVKGINFVSLRDAGDPVEQALIYSEERADELAFLDITASHEARDIVIDMVRKVADAVTIPFTVGGGLRTVEDLRSVLLAGADKTLINSSAVRTPDLIGEVAFLDGEPRSATVTALTDGVLARLSWESFEQIQRESPSLAVKVALGVGEVLARRLRASNSV